MINFLLEKVIRCAQMSVDCLRASKLVTLGYVYPKYYHDSKECCVSNKCGPIVMTCFRKRRFGLIFEQTHI